MHSMYLAGVPLPWSMLRQPIHFAPGRHADLVTQAVIADRGACGMRAVKEIIARERRIIAARVPDAIVNGVVPVVIVIGVLAVPAAIVRL